jgi:hypothetical protein
MHILLRHALTGQYYRCSGKWTANLDQAHDFRFINRAMSFIRKMKCPNMEVNLSFDTPRQAAAFRLQELRA